MQNINRSPYIILNNPRNKNCLKKKKNRRTYLRKRALNYK